MNDEVFKAILALDSYNRGYHPGISGLDDTPDVTFLGNAKIVRASQDGDDIGFYAIAYAWNGETIISYRGTDTFPDPQTVAIALLAMGGNPQTLPEVRP